MRTAMEYLARDWHPFNAWFKRVTIQGERKKGIIWRRRIGVFFDSDYYEYSSTDPRKTDKGETT